MPSKPQINIVWFKRDLRLSDHAPLKLAIEQAEQTHGQKLLLYIFEPMLVKDPHYSLRHWRFVCESLDDMNQQLKRVGAQVVVKYDDPVAVFEAINQRYSISTVFSHQETGLANTFERDKRCSQWFKRNGIEWRESQTGAVVRGAVNRQNWDFAWKKVMRAELEQPDLNKLAWQDHGLANDQIPAPWLAADEQFQRGGRTAAEQTIDDFFEDRGKSYHWQISKPLESQQSCSRMSPYLAWGCVSLREFYQALLKHWGQPGWRRALSALSSRLHWHCHFVQKFESECSMEFDPVNAAYRDLPYRDAGECASDLEAWKRGLTGYPLVDACMRSVTTTGYLNFRMRAMLVSFLCHHLNIDWRMGTEHLASLFLDFEPGIHYPQFQMQASVTGINSIRIYNPTKQAIEHDPRGEFILKYCPELSQIPLPQLFEPWMLTPMEQIMYDVNIGQDYPAPIVDIKESYRLAQQRLWSFKARPDVKSEAKRILARHVRSA